MSQDQEPVRRTDKGSSGGQNYVWYIVAVGALAALAIFWIVHNAKFVIDYPELVKLIEANPARSEDGEVSAPMGSIVVEQGSGDDLKKTRISNLRDVVVGPLTVTGMVDLEFLTTKNGAAP